MEWHVVEMERARTSPLSLSLSLSLDLSTLAAFYLAPLRFFRR